MSARTRVVLDAAPSLGSLYAKATGARLRQMLPDAKREALDLPHVEHQLAHVSVDPAKLVAYQRLMGDTVRDTLPSVFVHGLVFPLAMSVMVRDDFPLPLLGMVHLSNTVNHVAPIPVDATLGAIAWAESMRGHRAGTAVDVIVEVTDGIRVLWRGVSTYLARGVWLGSKPGSQSEAREPFIAPARTGSWKLAADTGRAYAAVMGDYNPIHLSAFSAKALGLQRAIAHGMYMAGRALAGATPQGTGYDWEIEFATPAFLPSSVDVAFEDKADGMSFSGWGARSGKPHFSGSITVAPRTSDSRE